jgi:hypothetical protein
MGLLQNISLRNAEPYDRLGDTSEMWVQTLVWSKNKYFGTAYLNQKSGTPDGFTTPYSFTMPIKEGGMSSFSLVAGAGQVKNTSYFTGAIALRAALHRLEGFGEITQSSTSLSLLVKLVAAAGQLEGSGEITNASLLKAIANMSASGASALTGEGQIDDSPLNLIAWCSTILTPLVGEGEISATLKGWCDLTADITSAGEMVTAQSCAAAVWSALASVYNESGTMGQKLNSAAVGGVDYDALAEAVWDAEISGRTSAQAGKAIEDIKSKTNLIPGLF